MKEKERKKESISLYHILKSLKKNLKVVEREIEMVESLIQREKEDESDLPTTIAESGLDKQIDQIVQGFMQGPKYQRMKKMNAQHLMLETITRQATRSGIDQNLVKEQEDNIKKILEDD